MSEENITVHALQKPLLASLAYTGGLALMVIFYIANHYVSIPDYGMIIALLVLAYLYVKALWLASSAARWRLAPTLPLVALAVILPTPIPVLIILAGALIIMVADLYLQLRKCRANWQRGSS
jgi:hypothetical protein